MSQPGLGSYKICTVSLLGMVKALGFAARDMATSSVSGSLEVSGCLASPT